MFFSKIYTLAMTMTCALSCTYEHARVQIDNGLSKLALSSTFEVSRESTWTLSADTRFDITPVSLLQPHTSPASRAMAMFNRSIFSAFKRQFPHSAYSTQNAPVGITNTTQLAANLSRAYQSGHDILVISQLMLIKNKSNTWSEVNEAREHAKRLGRDEIQVQLLLYETRTARLLDAIHIKSFAPMYRNNDKLPMHLFKPALDKVLAALAGAPSRA